MCCCVVYTRRKDSRKRTVGDEVRRDMVMLIDGMLASFPTTDDLFGLGSMRVAWN